MAGFITSTTTGIGPLLEQLRQLEREVPKEYGQALYLEANAMIAEAKKQTPVEYGRLRNSAFVELPKRNGERIEVRMGFGTDYALWVHERTELRHKTGKAKFLTDAVALRRAGFRERMVARITALVAKRKKAAL